MIKYTEWITLTRTSNRLGSIAHHYPTWYKAQRHKHLCSLLKLPPVSIHKITIHEQGDTLPGLTAYIEQK